MLLKLLNLSSSPAAVVISNLKLKFNNFFFLPWTEISPKHSEPEDSIRTYYSVLGFICSDPRMVVIGGIVSPYYHC